MATDDHVYVHALNLAVRPPGSSVPRIDGRRSVYDVTITVTQGDLGSVEAVTGVGIEVERDGDTVSLTFDE